MKSLLLNYPATIEVTQLGAQVAGGKQEKDMQLRLMLHLAVRSGNITYSRIRSTHLPKSSPSHRPQLVILSKIFNVRLGEDFDCVSLVETCFYQEHFTDRRASLHTEAEVYLSADVV